MTVRKTGGRWGVRASLMAVIGGVLSGTLIAAAVALNGYGQLESTINKIVGYSIPSMTEALTVAQGAERLVALAPLLASLESADDQTDVAARLKETAGRFTRTLASLSEKSPNNPQVARIEQAATALLADLNELQAVTTRRLQFADQRMAQTTKLIDVSAHIQQLLAPWKSVAAGDEDSAAMSVSMASDFAGAQTAAMELMAARGRAGPLIAFSADLEATRNVLLEASQISDVKRIGVIGARSEFQLTTAEGTLASLPDQLAAKMAGALANMRAAASGPGGLVALRLQELEVLARSNQLLTQNRALATQLSSVVEELVAEQKDAAATDVAANATTLDHSRLTLIAVSLLSVVASVLVVWLYVGRNVVRRLLALKESMGRIASGDLSAPVEAKGGDEIAEMAAALAVFRDNAEEALALQRRSDDERRRRGGARVAKRRRRGFGGAATDGLHRRNQPSSDGGGDHFPPRRRRRPAH
ncbi:MAG TPA: HAMP domain-containing protein [Azospirillaceae bacterium]|nr:HAMP domain-containing protein [Azospirillaceae bacterium]